MQGLLTRLEFVSLTSSLNEIGHESADYICKMLDKNYGEPPAINIDLITVVTLDEKEEPLDNEEKKEKPLPVPVAPIIEPPKPILHLLKYGKNVP